MARVALSSCVYLGDVAPFIPIARRLHERGHEVVFVAPEGFRPVLEREPVRFHPYALDCSPAMMNSDPRHARLMRHPVRNVTRLGSYWMDRAFADDPDAAVASLQEGFAGADVVITHPTMGAISVPVAHAMGIPVVAGHLFPMMIPTAHWTPPLWSASRRWPKPLNRAAWRVTRRMSGRAFRDSALNATRTRLGQPHVLGNAGWAWLAADATVVLASRHYFGPSPPDWPPHTWGGFSTWRPSETGELDAELDAYVDDGDPPVLVTLGTSAATDAGAQFARIAADLDARGVRSVLLVGHESNLSLLSGRPGVRTFAPIDALLPRCRAAVVSGALGGVAAALTAGVPVVVHPQLFDQVWHGGQVERLGVGLSAWRTSRVAAAVDRVVGEPAHGARARALAARMAEEDGAEAVVAAAEALLSGG